MELELMECGAFMKDAQQPLVEPPADVNRRPEEESGCGLQQTLEDIESKRKSTRRNFQLRVFFQSTGWASVYLAIYVYATVTTPSSMVQWVCINALKSFGLVFLLPFSTTMMMIIDHQDEKVFKIVGAAYACVAIAIAVIHCWTINFNWYGRHDSQKKIFSIMFVLFGKQSPSSWRF
jgi:hypothetical protein